MLVFQLRNVIRFIFAGSLIGFMDYSIYLSASIFLK